MARLTLDFTNSRIYEYVFHDESLLFVIMKYRNYKIIRRVLEEFDCFSMACMWDGFIYDIRGLVVSKCGTAYKLGHEDVHIDICDIDNTYVELTFAIEEYTSFDYIDECHRVPLKGRFYTSSGEFAIDVVYQKDNLYGNGLYFFEAAYDYTEWLYDEDTNCYQDLCGNYRNPSNLDQLYFR